jgi:hypothetical protein
MVEQFNRDLFDPGEFFHGIPHVARHKESEVGCAPVCRQPELDSYPTAGFDLHPGNKFQFGDGLVNFWVGHSFEGRPYFVYLTSASHENPLLTN